MTTSISSVSAGSTAASEVLTKKSSISNETKAKLEALGIPVTDGMTESEAQSKISQAEAQKQSQNGGQQQNSSESEILSRAKTLASQVGVTVSSDADISEILDDIGAELETLLEEAEGNPTRLSTLSSYLNELMTLDEQYSSIQSSQQGMYAAMNMVSTSNKISLGLS